MEGSVEGRHPWESVLDNASLWDEPLAQWIERSPIALAEVHGFYEYYDPETGKGLGENDFSWSAALITALVDDLLQN